MQPFTFQTVPDIRFGSGMIAGLPEAIERFAARRALIVTDAGVRAAGLVEPAADALNAAGIETVIFDRVVADPPDHVIHDATAAAAGVDLIIGLGGGSSMDAAKLAAVLATGEQPLADMYGVGKVTAARLPLVLIPTTAGTGSEVTPISIVTTGETTKMGVVSPVLYADIALLDPDLTLAVPQPVTAATGIDAMVHAIEAYTSLHKKNPLSDALARQALSLLHRHVPGACAEPGNKYHRGGALLGAMLAGQAFANAPVAAVHALAYPLGGIYHLPHGLTNALMLPHVLRFNRPAADGLYAELGGLLGVGGADGFIDEMARLSAALGLPQKLREVEVSQNRLPELAEEAMKQTRLLVNNPRPVTLDDARGLYEQAW